MAFFVDFSIKLSTRNRFRNFSYEENRVQQHIFTKWNVNLLLNQSQIYSYYLTNYT